MPKLRVAIVAPSLEILGGQSVQADLLLRAWRDDPDVHAWLVPVNPEPIRSLRWARQVKYLRTIVTESTYSPRLLKELRHADIVHVFSAAYWSFLLAPLPAVAAARALGRPVIVNYHSGEAADHLRRSRIARAVLARVDGNIVPSRFLVEVFAGFGLTATAVPNIVDLARFVYRERSVFRPTILSSRSFEDHYNVACTIRAFRLIQDRVPEASLTLAGGGSREAELRTLVADLGLRNVTFAGRIPPNRIADVCAAHDVYLQSPRIDNMPLSILEAFASGLPVVTTNAGGIPFMVAHRVNGLMADTDDHETLASLVLELVANPALGRLLTSEAAKSRALFAWPLVRSQWLGIYRDVVARAATAGTRSLAAGPAMTSSPGGEQRP